MSAIGPGSGEPGQRGYSPQSMRTLAVVGAVCTVLLFALGFVSLALGVHKGWIMIAIGAASAAFWAVMIPFARGRQRL
jgi:hypothetical protein